MSNLTQTALNISTIMHSIFQNITSVLLYREDIRQTNIKKNLWNLEATNMSIETF